MDTLIEKCRRKLRLTQTEHVRSAIETIGWDNRLIAIRGAKGVGKTTLMLQYLRLHACDCRTSLYISLDDAYFTQHTLTEFVAVFYKLGGKRLMIDEVHKYPQWSIEVKNIYDDYPDMKVALSGSSLLNILNGDADLSRRCIPYEVQGLSYREYLLLVHGVSLPVIALDDLLRDPQPLCDKVNQVCRPLAFFDDYLQHGYYPFFLEGQDTYHLRIENVVDYILNVELPQLCKVDIGAVRKLQSLLAILASNVPMQVDISKLSAMVGVSRVTLLGYLQYLNRARLLNLLYADADSVKKLQKPDKIYLENANLMHTLCLAPVNTGTLREAFLVGQLMQGHRVEYAKQGDLLVDSKYTIEIGGKGKGGKQIAEVANSFIAADEIEDAQGNKVPLWAFGFLY